MSPRFTIVPVLLLLLMACDRSASSRPGTALRHSASTASPAGSTLPPAFPPESCTPDGYRSFFEAFTRTPSARGALTLATARSTRFDVALRDYSWVLASDPDTSLDIEETRTGSTFSVRARPVERNEDDEVVRVLGPVRTYRFAFGAHCWGFAGAD